MKHLLCIAVSFVVVACLLQCVMAFPEAKADRAAAKVQRADEAAAKVQRADEADVKERWWPTGSAIDLQKMDARDIEKIQIFRLEWPRSFISPARKEEFAKKRFATSPLTHEEDSEEIEGLLALLKRAEPYKKPAMGKLDIPDRVLVVHPVERQPFEILFSQELHVPFGDVHSLELKEALYSLAGGSTRMSIIHFDKEIVQRVINHSTVAAHQGGSSTATTTAEMHLTSEKGLTLYVRVRDAGNVLMEDEKPMHYGEAKVFKSAGQGRYIVLLHKP